MAVDNLAALLLLLKMVLSFLRLKEKARQLQYQKIAQ